MLVLTNNFLLSLVIAFIPFSIPAVMLVLLKSDLKIPTSSVIAFWDKVASHLSPNDFARVSISEVMRQRGEYDKALEVLCHGDLSANCWFLTEFSLLLMKMDYLEYAEQIAEFALQSDLESFSATYALALTRYKSNRSSTELASRLEKHSMAKASSLFNAISKCISAISTSSLSSEEVETTVEFVKKLRDKSMKVELLYLIADYYKSRQKNIESQQILEYISEIDSNHIAIKQSKELLKLQN